MVQKIYTKERIFCNSIHLFADNGYESVSMKKIANASGIQSASIYNHYESKAEILKNIYQYFIDHQNACRPTKQEYLPILKKGTAVDILEIFNYPMPDAQDPEPLMSDIIRILLGRLHTDSEAKELYREYVVDEAYRYIDEVLCEGITLGRIIMPSENIHTFASILLAIRNYVASAIPLYSDISKWCDTGTAMIRMLAGTLNLNPPLE